MLDYNHSGDYQGTDTITIYYPFNYSDPSDNVLVAGIPPLEEHIKAA